MENPASTIELYIIPTRNKTEKGFNLLQKTQKQMDKFAGAVPHNQSTATITESSCQECQNIL
jgi:hypothetical protein